MAKRILTRCLILAISLVAYPALAQAEAGDGIKSGAFTLTPGVSLRGVYDTNLFYQSIDEAETTGAPSITVEPFFRIVTEETNNLQLSLDSSVAWQQYVGDDVVNEQSGLSLDVGLGAAFNTQGAFSFRIEDRVVRTNEPPSNPTSFSYNRLTNRLGVVAGLHPGGRALQHYLSYDWSIYRHDPLDDLDRMAHNFGLKNYWLFLPKTSVVLSADYSIISYDNPLRDAGGNIAAPTFAKTNSSPLRITGGLTGLITNRIGLRLIGGYGWSFHEANAYQGLLVDVQGQWFFGNLSEQNKLYVGYSRDFADATISTYYSYDKPYLGYSQGLFSRRLRLDVTVDAAFRAYSGVPAGAITGPSGDVIIPDNLSDILITARAGLDYNITKWWSAGVEYSFSGNFTDDVITTTTPGPDVLRDYQRNTITVNTTVRY